MATYKVIQDIEAEDKLLGPLSLRQFIYAVIVVVLGFLMFTFGKINPLLVIPFLPPAILFGFLAAPLGHDQSSEIWLLAKIRFIIKPRARVWNQSGLQQLVTITAPKKVERMLTNGLDQYQVQSRLQALARTIDTRGWAVKGVDVNMLPSQMAASGESDRLVGVQNFVSEVPDYEVTSHDDMLDTATSPIAQQVDQLMKASTSAHREAILERMHQATTPPGQTAATELSKAAPSSPSSQATPPLYLATPPIQTPYTTAPQPPEPAQGVQPSSEETTLLQKVHEQAVRDANTLGRMHTLVSTKPSSQAAAQPPTLATDAETDKSSSVTQVPDPGILELANNDDLTVATIARQVHKNDSPPNNEVVISLH